MWSITSFPLIHFLFMVSAGTAIPTTEKRGPKCSDFKIPIMASATIKLLTPIPNLMSLADPNFLVDYILSQVSGTAGLTGTTNNVTNGTFNIAMRYCEPEVFVESRAGTIQYLQHAITMTKDYWNGLTFPNGYMGIKYSWIDYASKQGYPTLSVDALGSGKSDRPDPLVVQMPLQVEMIHDIISMVRAGTIPNPVLSGKSFSKVIFAGHSYGSISGNVLPTAYPSDVDAFVHAGYSRNFKVGLVPLGSGTAIPAAIARPDRYASLLNQPFYLAQSVQEGRRTALYTHVGGYDPAIVAYDFKNEGTVALGELATLFYGIQPAPDYEGYIFILTGKDDAIVCNDVPKPDSGSGASSIPEQAREFFPMAKNFTAYIPNLTGHNPNLHYSGPESFRVVHDSLESWGF